MFSESKICSLALLFGAASLASSQLASVEVKCDDVISPHQAEIVTIAPWYAVFNSYSLETGALRDDDLFRRALVDIAASIYLRLPSCGEQGWLVGVGVDNETSRAFAPNPKLITGEAMRRCEVEVIALFDKLANVSEHFVVYLAPAWKSCNVVHLRSSDNEGCRSGDVHLPELTDQVNATLSSFLARINANTIDGVSAASVELTRQIGGAPWAVYTDREMSAGVIEPNSVYCSFVFGDRVVQAWDFHYEQPMGLQVRLRGSASRSASHEKKENTPTPPSVDEVQLGQWMVAPPNEGFPPGSGESNRHPPGGDSDLPSFPQLGPFGAPQVEQLQQLREPEEFPGPGAFLPN